MRAVDRHISSYLTSKTANILDIIDSLQNGSRSARSKEMMGQLYIDVMRVFGESQSLESHGYSSLIQADGKIDSDKLDELIDLDSEMSSYTAGLERVIVSVENRNGVSNGEYLQIRQFIDIILELLERRRVLVESG